MVSPFPLLFFGGNISTSREDFQDLIQVDDWIKFQASPRIAKLVQVSSDAFEVNFSTCSEQNNDQKRRNALFLFLFLNKSSLSSSESN